MAKQGGLPCSEAWGIARRSMVLRRCCGVEDEHDVLASGDANKRVREVRQDDVKVRKKKGKGNASWVRREGTLTATDSGG